MFKTELQKNLECLQKQICDIKNNGGNVGIKSISIQSTLDQNTKVFSIILENGNIISTNFSVSNEDIYLRSLEFDKNNGILKAIMSNNSELSVNLMKEINDVLGLQFI